jgi:hypothetical protein
MPLPPNVKAMICPYCGHVQEAGPRCSACHVEVDSLTRQATQNDMGPWFVRDPNRPHFPGCSYETMGKLVSMGVITKHTVVRGPSTQQFWMAARRAPGIAHLLGYCHECDAKVSPKDLRCPACRVAFGAWLDRDRLGLDEIRGLPGDPDHAPHVPRKPGHTISAFAPDSEIAIDPGGGAPPPEPLAPREPPPPPRGPSPREITLEQELAAAAGRSRLLAILAFVFGLIALGALTWLAIAASLQPPPAGS